MHPSTQRRSFACILAESERTKAFSKRRIFRIRGDFCNRVNIKGRARFADGFVSNQQTSDRSSDKDEFLKHRFQKSGDTDELVRSCPHHCLPASVCAVLSRQSSAPEHGHRAGHQPAPEAGKRLGHAGPLPERSYTKARTRNRAAPPRHKATQESRRPLMRSVRAAVPRRMMSPPPASVRPVPQEIHISTHEPETLPGLPHSDDSPNPAHEESHSPARA